MAALIELLSLLGSLAIGCLFVCVLLVFFYATLAPQTTPGVKGFWIWLSTLIPDPAAPILPPDDLSPLQSDMDLLAMLLRQAEAAHKASGDPAGNWAEWYAQWMLTHSTLNTGIRRLSLWDPSTVLSDLSTAVRSTSPNFDPRSILSHLAWPHADLYLQRLCDYLETLGYTIYHSRADWPSEVTNRLALYYGNRNTDLIGAMIDQTHKVILFGDLTQAIAGRFYLLLHETLHLTIDQPPYTIDRYRRALGIPNEKEMQYEAEAELAVYITLLSLSLNPSISIDYMANKTSYDRVVDLPFLDRLRVAEPKAIKASAVILPILQGTHKHNCHGILGQNVGEYNHSGASANLPDAPALLAKLQAFLTSQGIRIISSPMIFDNDPHTNAMSSQWDRTIQIRSDILACPQFAVYVLAHESGHIFGAHSTLQASYNANVLNDGRAYELAEGEAELTADLFIHQIEPTYPDLAHIYFRNHRIGPDILSDVAPTALAVAKRLILAVQGSSNAASL